MSTRLEALRGMLQQDPANAFVRYGVAMELVNQQDLEGAVQEFAKLRELNANYAAAYYHGGQTLEKLGRVEEAKEVIGKVWPSPRPAAMAMPEARWKARWRCWVGEAKSAHLGVVVATMKPPIFPGGK